MYMRHGDPLPPEDRTLVVGTIMQMMKEPNQSPYWGLRHDGWSSTPREVLEQLGWPQRRYYDLRDFLEHRDGRDLLGVALGRGVSTLCTRSQLAINFDKGVHGTP